MRIPRDRLHYGFVILWICAIVLSTFPVTALAQSSGGWKEKWDKTLTAAKKEGTVVVFGPVGQEIRQAITQGFKKAFPDISIEYTGGREADFATKILAERDGGIYSVDVVMAGPSMTHLYLKPKRVLDPIEPALILPEVTNLKNWRDNQLHFSDTDGKYNLAFIGQASAVGAYDPKQVKPEEVDDLSKLLDPKWKGKIVINDPIPPGAGHTFFRWLWRMMGPEKATDYFKKLRAQAGAVDRDLRRQLEWVAQGRFAILLPPADSVLQQLVQTGVKIGELRELRPYGTWVTSSVGTVVLINKAPHSNAAAVFLNWLLSKEGQTAFSQALNSPSRRLDVPTDHLPPYVIPKPGVKYWQSYLETNTRRSEEEEKVIQDLFGR